MITAIKAIGIPATMVASVGVIAQAVSDSTTITVGLAGATGLCIWHLSATLRGLKDGQKACNDGIDEVKREIRTIRKHIGLKPLIEKEESST